MTTNETDLSTNGEETAEGSPEAAEDTATPPDPQASIEEPQAEAPGRSRERTTTIGDPFHIGGICRGPAS